MNWLFGSPFGNDPEFIEILKEMKSLVRARHDEISQWLEENEKLHIGEGFD